ncbi:aminopeptidase [Flavobacterium humi]|uniref:Aminopeptidase n=2 Tax=Flavobacterium humi TaxID=2562683 RepID=A0A4Z0LDB8_9FLAO|nr:aminopeptidase [Flavobacterium humi]
MTVVLDTVARSLQVGQSIRFTNTSNVPISKIVLNDWNNAYSDKYSRLGKRFSDEFVRSFHLASESERGRTEIGKLLINGSEAGWNRLLGQVDIVEVALPSPLAPGQSTDLEISYALKIPDAKFTRFGYDKGNYYLKNCFLSVARISENGEFATYSNENLEDIANATIEKLTLDFTFPEKYKITSGLAIAKESLTGNGNTVSFTSGNTTDIQFAIEKNASFESFTNDQVQVETNLYDSRLNGIQKAIVIDRVVTYVSANLGKLPTGKIMVSQVDYERNPFYGLNQLPAFLSPFPDEFIYEIKFLKAYLYNYLKSTLTIDLRKEGYIFDAMQVYLMMKYIEDNHPDMRLLGNLSSYKLTKSYHIANAQFNQQYNFLYLLMVRKNLDQPIGDSKETFIKFNEQIAGKYKAGLSFMYLDKYLGNGEVEKSFREFVSLSKEQKTDAKTFEAIVQKNAGKNIDWFFPNLIYSNALIDYSFGKKEKSKDSISVTIHKNSKESVPVTLTGIKDRKVIFTKWLENMATDTTLVFPKHYADKLVLNQGNEFPENNLRNNTKSLRSFFSLNRPIKFNFLKDLEDPKYNQVFYVPDVGYNLYDGAIISLNFKNKSFLEKPFYYNISPSYSTNTNSLTGLVAFSLNHQIRNKKLYGIRYGIGASYFHYIQDAAYTKISPSIQFRFRDLDLRSNKKQFVTLREIIVNKEKSPLISPKNQTPLNYSVFDASYSYQDFEMAKGFGLGSDFTFSGDFGKMTSEIVYRKLFANNYQLGFRVFAGMFLYNKNLNTYAFGLDRPKDILFDYNFYGRSENTGFFRQQIIIAEGGFKSKLDNPFANKWMTTVNATSSIWHWIELYGDAGFYQNRNQSVQFAYDSGIHLNLVPDYFELFLPVYSTNGFELGQKNYQEKIRFVVTFTPRTLISLFTRKWF